MRTLLTAVFLFVAAQTVAAPDYTREKKWADEITPSIIVGDPIYLEQANGHRFMAIYTQAAKSNMALVIVHGMGIHPDWGMVGTLRQRLADLGHTTLSIQMPILAADANPQAYAAHLPEAAERLQFAVKYLKGKGYKRVAVVSHSMGSRMAHRYLTTQSGEVQAWASLGMPAALGTGAVITYNDVKIPVLDLYGENDLPDVRAGGSKRKASLKNRPGSRQVILPAAGHFYTDHEDAMVATVKAFLDSVK